MNDMMRRVAESCRNNPMKTRATAIAAGILIGMWFAPAGTFIAHGIAKSLPFLTTQQFAGGVGGAVGVGLGETVEAWLVK